MRTNSSMTIYNKFNGAGATLFKRTELPAVKWENRKAANVIKSGLLAADAVVIYIPFLSINSHYVKPLAWRALTVKNGLFTFQVGDYIVRGSVIDEISSEFTLTDLKNKYDDVVKITTVDLMDAGSRDMHHFQLGCS